MTKRLFIAINLPEELKKSLDKVADKLKKTYKNSRSINFVDPKIMHITLAFLGDVEEVKIDLLKEIIFTVCEKYKKTKIETSEFSAFPSEYNPKVLFLENINEGNSLFSLQRNLLDNFLNKGFEPDLKRLRLHITIARIKSKMRIDFKSFDFKKFVFKVESIDLMESRLENEGPQYKIIEKFNLK